MEPCKRILEELVFIKLLKELLPLHFNKLNLLELIKDQSQVYQKVQAQYQLNQHQQQVKDLNTPYVIQNILSTAKVPDNLVLMTKISKNQLKNLDSSIILLKNKLKIRHHLLKINLEILKLMQSFTISKEIHLKIL